MSISATIESMLGMRHRRRAQPPAKPKASTPQPHLPRSPPPPPQWLAPDEKKEFAFASTLSGLGFKEIGSGWLLGFRGSRSSLDLIRVLLEPQRLICRGLWCLGSESYSCSWIRWRLLLMGPICCLAVMRVVSKSFRKSFPSQWSSSW